MLKIRVANTEDYATVRDFYYSLIDAMDNAMYKPGWKKDVYPTQEFLIQSIQNKELYIAEINETIAGCMVVNHKYNEGYNTIRWSIQVNDSELFVIHALGVHPHHAGKGLAKQMVLEVIRIAQEKEIKTIRLDVLEGNIPAERAYTKTGFTYLDTLRMFYEDTGWTAYKLFEYII